MIHGLDGGHPYLLVTPQALETFHMSPQGMWNIWQLIHGYLNLVSHSKPSWRWLVGLQMLQNLGPLALDDTCCTMSSKHPYMCWYHSQLFNEWMNQVGLPWYKQSSKRIISILTIQYQKDVLKVCTLLASVFDVMWCTMNSNHPYRCWYPSQFINGCMSQVDKPLHNQPNMRITSILSTYHYKDGQVWMMENWHASCLCLCCYVIGMLHLSHSSTRHVDYMATHPRSQVPCTKTHTSLWMAWWFFRSCQTWVHTSRGLRTRWLASLCMNCIPGLSDISHVFTRNVKCMSNYT